MLGPNTFFDISEFSNADIFECAEVPWDALRILKQYMGGMTDGVPAHELLPSGVPLAEPLVLHEGEMSTAVGCSVTYGATGRGELKIVRQGQELTGASLLMAGTVLLGSRIRIGRGVLVEPGVMIKEPAMIGDWTEVRQGAYLRGYCLVGQRCVVGHTTEMKHSIFLNDAKAGHFAYVGDSILGSGVNLGAGTKLANFRFIPGEVRVKTPEGYIGSGLKKFGAVFGDRVQTGCNTVTSPGTVIGPDSIIMPNTTVPSGYHPPRSVLR